MYDPYAEIEHLELQNGLSIYAAHWNRDWEKVRLLVHAGAKDDPEGKEGCAHFMEHMVSENAEGWSLMSAMRHFEKAGGEGWFGSTAYNGTWYSFSIPLEKDILTGALSIFGAMLIDCQITKFMERERNVVLREYYENYPIPWEFKRHLQRAEQLFPNTRLARYVDSLGTPESIKAITQEDVQEFYDRYYTPPNISVVAIGGLSTEQLADALTASPFGKEKPGFRTPLPPAMTLIPSPSISRQVWNLAELVRDKPNKSSIAIHSALSRDYNKQALSCVEKILWEALFEKLRVPSGSTYGFRTHFSTHSEAYEFTIEGDFTPELLSTVEEMVNEAIAESVFNRDLIEHHIEANIRSFAVSGDVNANGLRDIASYDLRTYRRILTISEELEDAKRVTVEQVQAIIRHLQPEGRYTEVYHWLEEKYTIH